MFNLFSDSVKLELHDLHIVMGPSFDHLSHPDDFAPDPKQCFYDLNNQIENLVIMHEIMEKKREPAKNEER